MARNKVSLPLLRRNAIVIQTLNSNAILATSPYFFNYNPNGEHTRDLKCIIDRIFGPCKGTLHRCTSPSTAPTRGEVEVDQINQVVTFFSPVMELGPPISFSGLELVSLIESGLRWRNGVGGSVYSDAPNGLNGVQLISDYVTVVEHGKFSCAHAPKFHM